MASNDKGQISSELPPKASIIQESKVLTDNIGYLKITNINIRKDNLQELNDAMKKVEETKALVIDLRNNGGGGSEVGRILKSRRAMHWKLPCAKLLKHKKK